MGAAHAVTELSLNFAVFADFLRADEAAARWTRALRWALLKADRLFQLERLHSFNRKFFPHWRRRYFCFERWSDLPLAGLAYLHAESLLTPPGPVGQVAGSRRAVRTRLRRSPRRSCSCSRRAPRPRAAQALHLVPRRALRRARLRDVGARRAREASTSSSRPAGSCVLAERQDPRDAVPRHPLAGRRAAASRGCSRWRSTRDYATNHRFYVDYTDRERRHARRRSTARTARRAIPSSAKQLLFVKDFASNHNGGQLQFGPDGRLYWGNGDGGGGGDPQHNGQNLARPFAKIMRLNVNAAKPRWQLVAYGLRNPWRFSFDRETGDLYIGDVGQGAWEEIDYLPHGTPGIANFGWNRYEGRHVYDAGDAAADARHLPRAGRRVLALGRLLGHRRLRLPRHEGPRRGRAATSTATTAPARSGASSLERQGDAAAARAVHGRRALVVRRGRGGELYLMSVDSGDLSASPAEGRCLARAAAAHLRALRAERRVGERLQRLVQVAQLVRDHGQLLAPLLARFSAPSSSRDPVEPLEQRLELAVGDLSVLHGADALGSNAAAIGATPLVYVDIYDRTDGQMLDTLAKSAERYVVGSARP